MCGIAGSFHDSNDRIVEWMLANLAHRGPDGQGLAKLSNAVFGHTRLAILDIEGGHQPMEAGSTWITYNGEIYNYRSLAQEVIGDQHLQTHSDTEVLLHLYRKIGPSFVEKLDGMFALAILQDGKLFLARDPIGIKPLYYGGKDGILYFASEIKAISQATADIHEFPPGHWYHSRLGWHPFYQIQPPGSSFEGSQEEVCQAIREVLQAAVQKRLLADVPVGVSLSGGLDSSIIALLASQGVEVLNTFAVGMKGSQDLNAARKMASVLKSRHSERVYTEGEMIATLPRVIYHLESFDAALVRSAIPNYFLSELAAKQVKVILTGEGADEIYAGYDYLGKFDDEAQLQKEMVNITASLHNTNLQRADRVAMAFGLEARVPFLDKASINLAFGLPASWMIHRHRIPKSILRRAFARDLPAEIVNRPKQKFSSGAGSADIFARIAEREISDAELASERSRLLIQWNYRLVNKEELYYYRVLRSFYQDQWIFPTMGHSRSL